MTATPFDKTIMHGDLPDWNDWRVWAKKNSEGLYTEDSPTLVTPFQPPEAEFNAVGLCANINSLKHKRVAQGVSVRQFVSEYVTFLNTGRSVYTT